MFVLIAQNITIPLGAAAAKNLPFASALTTADGGFGSFLSGILSAVLLIAALLALLYLLWGGIEWITSGGDKGKTEKARDRITQAIIGLIVLAATLAILGIVQGFLGVTVLNFGGGSGSGGGSSSSNSGGSSNTCFGGVAINSAPISDGGSGGYCSGGGSAMVVCHGKDSHLSYPHFDPVSCNTGTPLWK